ncbi:MAG: type II toxin-antitoxin system ParD family antitoxin [Bacteroidales bacterium]|nr:type II toxin-antitoxin system ParD family antitoxin [Bacteroidales bacterium]
MDRNTSISLGSYFNNFIQKKLATGRYKNASEVVRAGLRLLEEEENRYIVLKEAINEGISSGIAYEFDPEKHLEMLKEQKNIK